MDAPRAPLGHLSRLGFALRNAADVDEIASSLLADLVTLPDVTRVGLALSEGAGRRLRFVASDGPDGELAWCHIDAYDDVPLTTVVRTGEPVLGSLHELGDRYRDHVAKHRELGTRAVACWPLPGHGAPLGGLVVYYAAEQAFGEAQRRLLEAAARWTAEAVRRVRTPGERGPDDEAPAHPAGEGRGLRADVRLEGDPRASRVARHFLRDRLAEWQVGGGVVDTALLCLSELVTNAVLHAGTDSQLTVLLEGGELTVVVRDQGGPSRSAGRAPIVALSADDDPLPVFGRGLTLVDALADRWGTEHHTSGTTAWFVLGIDDSEVSYA